MYNYMHNYDNDPAMFIYLIKLLKEESTFTRNNGNGGTTKN